MEKTIFEKFFHSLADLIKNTNYEKKTYVSGECVKNFIFKLDDAKEFEVTVEVENGGRQLATLFARKHNCFVMGENPRMVNDRGYCLVIVNEGEFKNIPIKFYQSRKLDSRVEMFDTIEADARTKDTTIDAMYINVSSGEFYDPYNAVEDYVNRIIVSPSPTENTFRTNPLKMIRIIRKSSESGFGIDKKTWFGILKNHSLIKNVIEKAYIAEEFNKILMSNKPSVGLNKLMVSGLLFDIMPQAYALNCISKVVNKKKKYFQNIWEHTLEVVDFSEPRLLNRLAAFFHDIGKPVTYRMVNDKVQFYGHENSSLTILSNIMKSLKYQDKTIEKIQTAVKLHMKFDANGCIFKPSTKSLRNFIKDAGDELDLAIDLIQSNIYAKGDNRGITTLSKIVNSIEDLLADDDTDVLMPINGKDIMDELGVKEGKIIGSLLNEVKKSVKENPNLTKEEAMNIVKTKFSLVL